MRTGIRKAVGDHIVDVEVGVQGIAVSSHGSVLLQSRFK